MVTNFICIHVFFKKDNLSETIYILLFNTWTRCLNTCNFEDDVELIPSLAIFFLVLKPGRILFWSRLPCILFHEKGQSFQRAVSALNNMLCFSSCLLLWKCLITCHIFVKYLLKCLYFFFVNLESEKFFHLSHWWGEKRWTNYNSNKIASVTLLLVCKKNERRVCFILSHAKTWNSLNSQNSIGSWNQADFSLYVSLEPFSNVVTMPF